MTRAPDSSSEAPRRPEAPKTCSRRSCSSSAFRALFPRGEPTAPLALVLALLLLCPTAPARARDPEGTIVLELGVGESAPVKSTPGANVLCDDPAIASGEFTADGNGFVIRAHRPGTTLCGVWLAGQTPGGLYRVQVKAPADGRRDGGADGGSGIPAPDAGGGDR